MTYYHDPPDPEPKGPSVKTVLAFVAMIAALFALALCNSGCATCKPECCAACPPRIEIVEKPIVIQAPQPELPIIEAPPITCAIPPEDAGADPPNWTELALEDLEVCQNAYWAQREVVEASNATRPE